MEIYRTLEGLPRDSENVLTVGTFDGIHLGHRFILEELVRLAHSNHGVATVVTFDPHPKQIVAQENGQPVQLLTTIEEKIPLLRQLHIQKLVILPFTKEFSQLGAEAFVRSILVDRVGMKGVVVGYDHAFGRNREGGLKTLQGIASESAFEVLQLDELTADGAHVSSTQIRQHLKKGQIGEANALLGYEYSVIGKVVRGDGRGKTLGFPTANLYISESAKLLPANGVYAVKAQVGMDTLSGMANIGTRPTFDGDRIVFEVHLFAFDDDIYDHELRISFREKIRNEVKFGSVEQLIRQLENDKMQTKQLFSHTQNAILWSH